MIQRTELLLSFYIAIDLRFEIFSFFVFEPEEVPQGNVPRSITVYIFGENTRKCQCGDKVTVTGIWLPLRASGFRAMKQGLRGQTYLHAQQISREKKGYSPSA